MKSYSIKGLVLVLAVSLFTVTETQAQSYEDVINTFNEATELARNGRNQQAITSFQRVIEISNRVSDDRVADIRTRAQNQIPQLYFAIARDLYNGQKLPEAAEAFNTAAEQAQRFGNQQIAQRSRAAIPQIHLAHGNNLLRDGNQQGALQAYDRALAARPAYAAAFYQKGLVYRQMENMDEALSYFDRAIQVGESSNEANIVENATAAARNFLLLTGVTRMENRQYRQSTELLRQALQYDDTNADVHYRLAEVFNKQALWNDAITHANRALELERGGRADRAKIYFELGYAQKNSGNFNSACESFAQAAFGNFRAAAEHAMEHELKCGQPNR